MLHFLIISVTLDGIPVRYALVQYSFKNGVDRANFKAKPHGNLKANYRARHDIKIWESTKECIRNSSKGLQPRDTVHQVLKEDIYVK